LMGSPRRWSTCGMVSLGLPDVGLEGVPESQDAAVLVDTLARYLLLDRPDIKDGESFGLGPNEPAFRMTKRSTDDNPFGRWDMSPQAKG
jgi:hypothetical protein